MIVTIVVGTAEMLAGEGFAVIEIVFLKETLSHRQGKRV